MLCRVLTVPVLSMLILLGTSSAHAEPPPEDERDILPYESTFPISADDVRRQAASFITMDTRFIFALTRESARMQTSPGFSTGYEATRAKGHFDGSETEYALLFAVNRMHAPFYGYGAQVYCPPNDPTYMVLLRHWRGKEIDCSTYNPMDRYRQD